MNDCKMRCMLKNYKFWLVLALCLMIVGTIFAGLIQNDFGKVEVKEISIQTDVGLLTGYLFVPKHSEGEKLPAIVASHGYLNNREMQDLNYVELSRRGFVVFAMNAYAHGDSSVVVGEDRNTISAKTGGMVDAVEYLWNLPFVNRESIGVTGHSMGGGYTNSTMNYYSSLYYEALAAGKSEDEAKSLNKISAGFITGNFPANMLKTEEVDGTKGYQCDVAVNGGKFDEFYRGMTGGVFGKDILTSENLFKVIAVQTGVATTKVENGQIFTNAKNGYTFTMYNPAEFHAQNHFSLKTAGNTIEFFNRTLTPSNPLSRNNQVWWLKELFNLVALIGLILFIVPFAKLLMATPFFSDLKAENIPTIAPLNRKGKYLATNLSSGVLSAILLLPLTLIGYVLLQSSWFPQDTTGGIGLWSAISGLIALLFLRISFGKLKGNGVELGFTIGSKKWFKTLLLSLTVIAGIYLCVFAADYFFQVDFRIWTLVMRIFDSSKIWVMIKYLPLFMIYYVINSMCLTRNNFENWSESKQVAVSIAFNIVGPLLFVLVSYVPVIFTGITAWGGIQNEMIASAGALVPIVAIPFIPILAIAGYLNVKLYKATGNIWLGGLVNSILITVITVANTSFSFPY